MRQSRIKGDGMGENYFHCISRVVDKRRIFQEAEKEYFVSLMRGLEGFMGMRVVTYVVMGNHFHLLVEQPDDASRDRLGREAILGRMSFLYDDDTVNTLRNQLDQAARSGGAAMEEQILAPFRKRMGDVSVFMKELKQRFTQWYNRRNDRTGTLWESRFKSLLVEGDEKALMTIAAYIDLNPIRAAMTGKVEDYRWCGYAAAVGGNERARVGLGAILRNSPRSSGEDFEENWEATGRIYRLWLYHEGETRLISGSADATAKNKGGFSQAEVAAESKREGNLSLREVLYFRVRYFSDGAIFGSAQFVNRICQQNPSRLGRERRSGARKMRDAEWGNFYVLRDPRGKLIG